MPTNLFFYAIFLIVTCSGFFNSLMLNSSVDITPDTFDFSDLPAASTSTVYEDSFLPVGYAAPSNVQITSGSGTVRKNSTGSWSTSVQIQPGDTLNIRMTSSDTEARVLTTAISIGSLNVDWQITTDFSCGGNPKINGSCWYLSTAGENCETTCASNNGYNTLTESYVGASTPNCESVLDALGAGSGTPTDQNWISLQCGFATVGCMIKTGTRYRCSAVSMTASAGSIQRVCGCNGLGAIDTTPVAFDFVDGDNVAAGTLYETSQVITGINTGVNTTVTGGEVRKNGSGGWGAAVTINDGDTLNLRATSSNNDTESVTATVVVGTLTVDWVLTTTHGNSCDPGMELINGACWTMSGDGLSCAAACSGSAYDSQTLSYTGSGGNNTNCDSVLAALGIGGGATTTDNSCGAGLGCHFSSGNRKRCSLATTDVAAESGASRACACTTEDVTPDTFDFTDITDAGVNGLYETSATVTGFTGTRTVNVTGGDAQIRKNNSGAWAAAVGVNAGDTLNLRMTSSGSMGRTETANLVFGVIAVDWTITTLSPCLAGGGEHSGSCWYYGGNAQSCDTVCSARGGYDAATASYAGANTGNCQQAFDAAGGPLGLTGGTVLDNTSCFINNIGCHFSVTARNLCNGSAVTSSASMINLTRVCACGSPDDITPDGFDFTDVTGATTSTVYEDSSVITGIDVAIPATAISGGIEVRKNGAGSWGSTVSLNSGDTLNVRVTSSSSAATAVSTTLSVGSTIVDWTVTTN